MTLLTSRPAWLAVLLVGALTACRPSAPDSRVQVSSDREPLSVPGPSTAFTVATVPDDVTSVALAPAPRPTRSLVVWVRNPASSGDTVAGVLVDPTAGTTTALSASIDTGATNQTLQDVHAVRNPSNGQFLVTWVRVGTSLKEVRSRLVDSAGTVLGTAVTVASGTSAMVQPRAAYHLGAGSFVIVYGVGNSVMAQVMSASGAAVGGPITVSTEANAISRVNVSAGGTTMAALWTTVGLAHRVAVIPASLTGVLPQSVELGADVSSAPNAVHTGSGYQLVWSRNLSTLYDVATRHLSDAGTLGNVTNIVAGQGSAPAPMISYDAAGDGRLLIAYRDGTTTMGRRYTTALAPAPQTFNFFAAGKNPALRDLGQVGTNAFLTPYVLPQPGTTPDTIEARLLDFSDTLATHRLRFQSVPTTVNRGACVGPFFVQSVDPTTAALKSVTSAATLTLQSSAPGGYFADAQCTAPAPNGSISPGANGSGLLFLRANTPGPHTLSVAGHGGADLFLDGSQGFTVVSAPETLAFVGNFPTPVTAGACIGPLQLELRGPGGVPHALGASSWAALGSDSGKELFFTASGCGGRGASMVPFPANQTRSFPFWVQPRGAGPGPFVIRGTVDAVQGTYGLVNVVPGPFARAEPSGHPPTTPRAVFNDFDVEAKDAYGNLVTDAAVGILVTLSAPNDPGVVFSLPGDARAPLTSFTFEPGDVGRKRLSASFGTPGLQTVRTAVDSGLGMQHAPIHVLSSTGGPPRTTPIVSGFSTLGSTDATTEVTVTPGPGGISLVTWLESTATPELRGYYALLDRDGALLVSPSLLAAAGFEAAITRPRAAFDGDRFLVVWGAETTTFDSTVDGVFVGTDGVASSVYTLMPSQGVSFLEPDVVWDPVTRHFVVGAIAQGPFTGGTHLQIVSSAGALVGASRFRAGAPSRLSLAASPGGTMLAVYNHEAPLLEEVVAELFTIDASLTPSLVFEPELAVDTQSSTVEHPRAVWDGIRFVVTELHEISLSQWDLRVNTVTPGSGTGVATVLRSGLAAADGSALAPGLGADVQGLLVFEGKGSRIAPALTADPPVVIAGELGVTWMAAAAIEPYRFIVPYSVDLGGDHELRARVVDFTSAGSLPPSELRFIQVPPSARAGVAFDPPVTVEVRTTEGVATDFNGAVTLRFTDPPGNGAVLNNPTVNAVGGLATFPAVWINKAGPYHLTAEAVSLASDPSDEILISSNDPSQLVWLQKPAGAAAGQPLSPTASVEIRDAFDNPVTSYLGAVTMEFFLPPGNGAQLAGEVESGEGGLADFPSLRIDRAGSYLLRARTGSLTSAPGDTVTVTAAGATQLVFTTAPASFTAGTVMAPSMVVELQDSGGNTVAGATGTVTLRLKTPNNGATVTNASAPVIDGKATFTDFRMVKAGTYQLIASDGTLDSAETGAFTVNPAAPDHLAFNPPPPTTGVAGTPLTQFVVEVRDVHENVVTGFGGSAQLVPGVCPSSSPVLFNVEGFVQGAATFSNVTMTRAGQCALDATVAGLPTLSSAPITVAAGTPSKLVFLQAPSDDVAGTAMTPAVTVEVQDTLGNRAASSATVTLSFVSAPAPGTTLTGSVASAAAGLATFTDVRINRVGTYALQAASPGLGAVSSGTFTISAGAPDRWVFTQPPAPTVTAGAAFAPAVQALLQDAAGNAITGFNSAVTLAFAGAAPAGASITNPTAPANAGVVTFPSASINLAGTYQLTIAGTPYPVTPSAAFQVIAGPASQWAITTQPPPTVVSNATMSVKAELQDLYGNRVDYDGAAQLAFSTPANGATLSGETVTAADGVAAFVSVSVDKIGVYKLIVSGAGKVSPETDAFQVTVGAAARWVFVTEPSNAVSSVPLNPTVQISLRDSGGNTVTTFAGPVTLRLVGSPAGVTLSGATVTAAGGDASFPALAVDKLGTYQLLADGAGVSSNASLSFDISPAPFDHFSVRLSTAPPDECGEAEVMVTAVDAAENPVEGSPDVQICAPDASGAFVVDSSLLLPGFAPGAPGRTSAVSSPLGAEVSSGRNLAALPPGQKCVVGRVGASHTAWVRFINSVPETLLISARVSPEGAERTAEITWPPGALSADHSQLGFEGVELVPPELRTFTGSYRLRFTPLNRCFMPAAMAAAQTVTFVADAPLHVGKVTQTLEGATAVHAANLTLSECPADASALLKTRVHVGGTELRKQDGTALELPVQPLCVPPFIQLTVTRPDSTAPGAQATFDVRVTNTGAAALDSSVLKIQTVGELTVVSAEGLSPDVEGFVLPVLAPQDTLDLKVVASVAATSGKVGAVMSVVDLEGASLTEKREALVDVSPLVVDFGPVGCGCDGTGASALGLWAVAFLGLTRRGRRRPHP